MAHYQWSERFRDCYDHATVAYERGERNPVKTLTPGQREFLASIGCAPRELFDFVEDCCNGQEPSYETCLLITAVRREYFLRELRGRPAARPIAMSELPPKEAAAAGLPWLPRIIEKARAKLRGEMPDDLMYCCGGDRAFLRKIDLHPADFLREVWAAGDDTQHVVRHVKSAAARAANQTGSTRVSRSHHR